MTSPAISLVVTTYNHSRFVDQCLDSVAQQTFRDFELLISRKPGPPVPA